MRRNFHSTIDGRRAYFGSVDRIKAAAAEELVKVDGITEKNAQNILKYFRG